ncbi:hypothetical protein D3C85_1423910 [compost metagenome]
MLKPNLPAVRDRGTPGVFFRSYRYNFAVNSRYIRLIKHLSYKYSYILPLGSEIFGQRLYPYLLHSHI